MRIAQLPFAICLFTTLAACGQPSADNGTAPAANQAVEIEEVAADDGALPATGEGQDAASDWRGVWTGPEGLALEILDGDEPGGYHLNLTLLDGADSFDGTADGDVIRFTRDGVEETVRRGSGDETGLKYLAGKRDCLIIKSGEGFCRG